MSIRVLIVDDHPVVRLGLRALLAGSDVEVTGEASRLDEVLPAVEQCQPHVVMMDVRMEKEEGLTALKLVKDRWPQLPVVMLSAYNNPTYVARAMSQGAAGYLSKEVGREEMLTAIRSTAAGQQAWSPADVRRYTGAVRGGKLNDDREVNLTHRESEVLHQMAYGLTNKEIADALGISYETVKEHVQHILKKLGVSDRTQAAVWAVRRDLV